MARFKNYEELLRFLKLKDEPFKMHAQANEGVFMIESRFLAFGYDVREEVRGIILESFNRTFFNTKVAECVRKEVRRGDSLDIYVLSSNLDCEQFFPLKYSESFLDLLDLIDPKFKSHLDTAIKRRYLLNN